MYMYVHVNVSIVIRENRCTYCPLDALHHPSKYYNHYPTNFGIMHYVYLL